MSPHNGWDIESNNGSSGIAGATQSKTGIVEIDRGRRWASLKSQLLVGAATVVGCPAYAQEAADPVPLPPLNVETTAKKKAPSKKAAKKSTSSQQVSPAPQPPVQAAPQQQANPLPGQAAPVPAGQYNATYSTSPKTTGPLLNTPQTVNVIPTAIIQERKSTNLLETLKNTPGITIDAGENGFNTGGLQFGIRGFNATGSVFNDGARDNGIYTRDMFNVEQVEVFKGPAADNGRGSAGGYVNIVTKTPKLGDFVEATIGIGLDEYDSEARRRATFDVNQSSGTVAARLNLFVQDGGVAGRDVAEANAWGAAPSLAFGLGTETRAIFSYEHYERHDLPDAGVRLNRRAEGLTFPGGRPVDSVGIGGAGPKPNGGGGLSRDTFFGNVTDYDDTVADTFIARFEHDLAPGITVSNQTRWSQVDREAVLSTHSSSFTTLGGGLQGGMGSFAYDRVNESLSNQTNLAARFYTGQFKHTVSTGVEFSREQSSSSRASIDIDTAAVYAYDTVELNRQWQVVGGLRVEHYDLEIDGGTIGAIPGVVGNKYSQNDTTVGGKVGVIYKPVENGSLYASYGISHLPHGSLLSNPDITRGDANAFPGFVAGADPAEFHNYEIGAKWDFFNGKLSATAALFRTEKHKAAIVGRDPGDTADSLKGYGKQIVEGIELGLAGNLTEHWKVFGGVLVMDSERQHSAYLDAARRAGNSGAGDYGTALRTDGDELAFTPSVTATFWSTYDVTKELTVGGGFQYVSDSWIGRPDDALRIIKNGRYGKLPSHFIVNLMASYDLTENIELSLNVDNVFDELYLTSTNWNGNWGYVAPPRTYWLSASYKY